MKTYRCGIVGFGYMGEIRLKVIDRHPQLELIGICETNPAKIEKLNQSHPTFNTVDELLKRQLDILFVCTPNKYSPEISIKAMNLGIHVFCEKPPGCCVQDIVDMRNVEDKTGIKLMFGFNHRFHPAILKAKRLMSSGRYGKLLSVRGIYGKSGGKKFPQSWRNDKTMSGGGILLDQGIHMLDLFRLFCDDFDQVKSFTSNIYWKFDIEDNAFVILQNKNQQMASIHSCASLWKHTFRMDLLFEEGYMIIEGLLSQSGSYGRERLVIAQRQFEDEADAVGNPAEQVIYFDRDESWDLEVEEFVKCINDNKEITMSSSFDALRVMQIIEDAYQDAVQSASKVK